MSVSRQKVAKSFVWTALESAGLSGLSLLTLVVFSRFLTPAQFGTASMALGVVQILNIPVELLFHDALVQRRSVERLHYDTAFTAAVCIGIVLFAGCWLVAPWFGNLVHEPLAGAVLRWMALSLPAMGFGSILIAKQRREMQFRQLAVRSLAGRLLGAFAGVIVAVMGGGVWCLVVQQVLMVGLATAALWLTARDTPRFRFSLPHFLQLSRFGASSTAVMALAFSIQRTFLLVVGTFLGAATAGYFNLAFRTVDMLRDLAGGAVSQLSLPLFSRLQDQPDELRSKFNAAVQTVCAVMLPVFGGLAVCSPQIVEQVFGQQWQPAVPYVAVVALLTFQFFPRMFSTPLMTAVGGPHYPLIALSAQFLYLICAMLVFGRLSAEAALIVWACRLIISTPIDILMLRHATGMQVRAQLAGVPLLMLTTGLMMAVVYLTGSLGWNRLPLALNLVGRVTTGIVTYGVLLWVMDRPVFQRVVQMGSAALEKQKKLV